MTSVKRGPDPTNALLRQPGRQTGNSGPEGEHPHGAAFAAEDVLDRARGADVQALRAFARACDWSDPSLATLGWVMAQTRIDLGTAVTAFFNGAPERFNTCPKSEVPSEFRARSALLDVICRRINAGFYLLWPDSGAEDAARVCAWLDAQDQDRAAGRRGRYVLDDTIIEPLMTGALRADPVVEQARHGQKPSLLWDVLSPVASLGVSRDALRFLPPDQAMDEDPEIEL